MFKRFIFFALFIFLFGSLFYFAFFSDFFKIKNILIFGTEFVSKDTAEKIAKDYLVQKRFFIPNSRLFFFKKEILAQKLLNNFPRIENIEVLKKIPDSIVLKINEREQIGVFCLPSGDLPKGDKNDEKCFLIDKNGVIFDNAPKIEGSLVLKIFKEENSENNIGDEILPASLIQSLLQFKYLFEKRTAKIVSEIKISAKDFVSLKAGGFEILFKKEADAKDLADRLFILINQEIKEKINKLMYVDMREGNKIFYKYK